MKRIKLTQGKFALVSNIDYAYLNQWKWYALKRRYIWYAQRNIQLKHKRTTELMHRVILGRKDCQHFIEVDHKDGNGLNNQRYNLRSSNSRQNKYNRTNYKNSKSGYKGVFWHKHANKWVVQIHINGKTTHIGLFDDVIDAAKAYNIAAKKYHGKFARLNILCAI